MDPFTYRWAGATDVGRVRDHNEDALSPVGAGAASGPLVFAVADGLGGLEAGEEASGRAIAAATADPAADPTVTVVDRLKAGDQAVVDFVLNAPDVFDSATTLTIASVDRAGRVDVAHVGDSRLYVYGDGVFVQVTADQTVAQRKVESGLITELEAAVDPGRHILTSACGLLDVMIQHISGIQLRSGDRMLLCSDGLTEMLGDGEISFVLGQEADPGDAVRRLIDEANAAGGRDNLTVIVVNVEAP